MPRSRVCLQCGIDMGRAAPWREEHYGLLVCACPRCGAVVPAPRQSRMGRQAWAWLSLLVRLGVLSLVVLIVIACTHLHDTDLTGYKLGGDWLVRLPSPRRVIENIEAYVRVDPTYAVGLAVMRLCAGLLAGAACLTLSDPRRFWWSYGHLILIAMTIQQVPRLLSASLGAGRDLSFGQVASLSAGAAAALLLTFALGTPARLVAGLGESMQRRARERRFRRLLRRARQRRRA